MKMVGHKAPIDNICNWQNIFPDFSNKKEVIFPTEKDLLFSISNVIDMIGFFVFKMHNFSLY